MNANMTKLVVRTAFAILGLIVVSGCQSMAGSQTGLQGSRTMPGKVASARYAYIGAAIQALNKSLGGSTINLDTIPIGPSLYTELPNSELKLLETAQSAVHRLATTDIINSSSYRLMHADTLTGRLEYRSLQTGAHLAVMVREPGVLERRGDEDFVVTDMVAQASLSALVRALPNRNILIHTNGKSTVNNSAFLKVGRRGGNTDLDTLAYFNSLPIIERDRQDLLGLRAMLMMRLNQNAQATKLVGKGIVRFPDDSMYYTLASVLFERKHGAQTSKPDSLSLILNKKFSRKQLLAKRAEVDEFLGM